MTPGIGNHLFVEQATVPHTLLWRCSQQVGWLQPLQQGVRQSRGLRILMA
jgi:hypothetical protein